MHRVEDSTPLARWERLSPQCTGDLHIKKFALLLIALINLSAIGAGLWAIVQYVPIPNEALVASPYVAGVLWGMASLQMPMGGVNNLNFKDYSNPAILLTKFFSYLFFTPYKILLNLFDWNDYANPAIAKEMVHNLKTKSFSEIVELHGNSFQLMTIYGLISEEDRQGLVQKVSAFQKASSVRKYWASFSKSPKKGEFFTPKATKEELERIERAWSEQRPSLKLPSITIPEEIPPSLLNRFFSRWQSFQNILFQNSQAKT